MKIKRWSFGILAVIIILGGILFIGRSWKITGQKTQDLKIGEWEYERELTIKETGESAIPAGAYEYDTSLNKQIPSAILSKFSLEYSYVIEPGDGLITHELPQGAVVKFYMQPVYKSESLTMKNWYEEKNEVLLQPQAPRLKMEFTNLGDQKDFEEIYEADSSGKYKKMDIK